MSLLPSSFFKDTLIVIDFQQFDYNGLHYLFCVFMGEIEILGSLGFWLLSKFGKFLVIIILLSPLFLEFNYKYVRVLSNFP